MRILITGVSGMLGHSLMRLAAERHEAWGSYRSFPVSFRRGQTFALELMEQARVRDSLRNLRPQAVVHTAALTDVDLCQQDPLMARQINVEATENLASVAGELGACFVYISTDYVFDGHRGGYAETDTPSPINVYGESKLLGEGAVQSFCSKALVIRTSIFGFNIQPKTGLGEYVIKSLKEGQTIDRFSDQFSTPIYTRDLGRLILALLDRGATGLFHVGGGEKISRYGFATQVAETFSLPAELIRPVPFRPLEGLAGRPRDSSLCGEKVESHLGLKLPKLAEGLRRLKEDIDLYQLTKATYD